MSSSQRLLCQRQSRTDLNQLNQSFEKNLFSTDDNANVYSGKLSKFENDHPRKVHSEKVTDNYGRLSKTDTKDTSQDYSADKLAKKPSLTTTTTRRKTNSYYQHTSKAPSRCQSLTDLRKSNPSNRSESSIRGGNVVNVSNGTIQICLGDITKQKVDAIIIASTSDYLTENVLKEAGDLIKTTYVTEKQQKKNLSICTNGGNLACKRIYFMPCPQMSKDADKLIFRKFVSEAIKIAINDRSTRIKSIAFPAIGCGQHGCDSNLVAKTLIMAVAYELEHQSSLQLDVYFVIQQHQQNIFDAFLNELKILKNNGSTYKTSQSYNTPVFSPPEISRFQQCKKKFVIEKRPLDECSSEYTKVIREFWSNMKSKYCSEIVRIELIWNERWYKQYMIHKEEFFQRLQYDSEAYLFHGCSEDAANSIIKECFNRSYAGEHGTSYGHGVYFSSKASYSHSYTTPNSNGERCMFLAKVLIGRTIIGNSSMKICPAGYDTTTDGSHIYVIYHDAQAFGYYLITYI